jgi:uncharacterized RDD family membrane protein YckC
MSIQSDLVTPTSWQAHRPIEIHYAGFWRRAAALLLDSLILWIPEMLLESTVSNLVRAPGLPALEDSLMDLAVTFCVSFLIWWVYRAALHSSAWQATLGKKALGIKVTDLSGERISFSRATARYFLEYLSAIPLGLGFVMAGITDRKQALHDKLAGTLVVQA